MTSLFRLFSEGGFEPLNAVLLGCTNLLHASHLVAAGAFAVPSHG